MMRIRARSAIVAAATMALAAGAVGTATASDLGKADHERVRFATFNASLNRGAAGVLRADLSTPNNAQARTIAEIIQRSRPDVLLINEFDYDREAPGLFQRNYLSVPQNGALPIEYKYHYIAPSNTGVASGLDLNND